MTCKPRQISGNEPFAAIPKDYNRYCDRIVGDTIPGGSPPVPVTPADLANLVRWHKADGVLYTDAAGADLVDTNLDPIGNATDESGVHNPVIQATTSAKPTWLSDGPAMSFDGGDDLRDIITSQAVGDMTFGVVFEASTLVKNICGQTDGANVNHWTLQPQSTQYVITYKGAGVGSTGVFNDIGAAVDTKTIIFVRFNATAKTQELYTYAGGSLVKSSVVAAISNVFDANLTQFGLGSRVTSGGVLFPHFQGNIYEDFQTSDVVSDEELSALGASFTTKWGVS